MPIFHQQIVALVVPVALALGGCGTDAEGELGAPCSDNSDCRSGRQCLAGACTSLCSRNEDCGGGYVCTDEGLCEADGASAGVGCVRELDCGPGLACKREDGDTDGDGRLSARCQPELPGHPVGGDCRDDADCRSGLCALGHCTVLCANDSDCSIVPSEGTLACIDLPDGDGTGNGVLFSTCLPAAGTVSVVRSLGGPSGQAQVPVPAHAVSFALTASVRDPAQLVGATRVVGPGGAVLYDRESGGRDAPLRFEPSRGASTVLVPNAPQIQLQTGVYRIDIEATRDDGGSADPVKIRVDYLVGGAGRRLDLDIHVAGLDSHPCAAGIGFSNADTADSAATMRDEFLPALDDIFAMAGIELGVIRFVDLRVAPEFAVVDAANVDSLLRLASPGAAVDLFLVRGIRPAGLLAVGGGARRGTRLANAPMSGVALSVDALCYRSWTDTARIAAHAIARQLGLFRNVEPDGAVDSIADSESAADNLLYFGEYGGTRLSPGQAQVLRGNPVLR